MKVLILEDEIPAYEKLLAHVETEIDNVELLGWGRSVAEAEHFIKKHKEDIHVIFSDIELLDGLSFEVFEKMDVQCPVIFCTAFDRYLLKAFQTNGIAYILKPYDKAQFKDAVDKYRALFGTGESNVEKKTISELKDIVTEGRPEYKKRFSVKKKSGIKLLPVDEIMAFQANGDFSFAIDGKGERHVVNYPIGEIEQKINPHHFFRINRSEIVAINYIEKLEPYFKNRLAIKLKVLKDPLYTSSSKTKDFRVWLEQ